MYSLLDTHEAYPARHPGVNGYTPMVTRNDQGFRGLGRLGIDPISFTLGPGGQFSFGVQSVPNQTSLWDQVKVWMGQSSVIAGVPNSLLLVGGGLFFLTAVLPGRRRR